jgi:hypothetical protein
LKASRATSATAAKARQQRTGQSSDRRRHTLTSADEFALAGPSDPPEPDHNAYRKDLADLALAGRVIASHYAEPVERHVERSASLRSRPSETADVIRELEAGESFLLLDDTLGWAWGYAGEDRRVGYVRTAALAG